MLTEVNASKMSEEMKRLIYIIITVIAGWFALNYITERTVEITLNQLEDERHTDWVKCAKEINDTTAVADSINTEEGESDEIR